MCLCHRQRQKDALEAETSGSNEVTITDSDDDDDDVQFIQKTYDPNIVAKRKTEASASTSSKYANIEHNYLL